MTWKSKASGVAVALALAAVALSACGSGSSASSAPAASAATLDSLASRSDRIAAAVDSGDTCGAAQMADDLKQSVSDSDLPDQLRAEAESGADQLVNEVNCEPEPREKPKEDKHAADEGDYGDEQLKEPPSTTGPPGQDGALPPGQLKKVGVH